MRYAERLDAINGNYIWEGNKLIITFDDNDMKGLYCDVCRSSDVSKKSSYDPTSESQLVRDLLKNKHGKKTLCQACNREIGSSVTRIRDKISIDKYGIKISCLSKHIVTCKTFKEQVRCETRDLARKNIADNRIDYNDYDAYSDAHRNADIEIVNKYKLLGKQISYIEDEEYGGMIIFSEDDYNAEDISSSIFDKTREEMNSKINLEFIINKRNIEDASVDFVIRKIKGKIK